MTRAGREPRGVRGVRGGGQPPRTGGPWGVAPRGQARPAALARRVGLILLAAAVLFFCYWRQSQAAPLSSDGSGNVLQAWDMLHGNLLLHGWWVSDVSFWTTELPQYMLVEALTGIGPWVVHAAAAMTYTLLVLLAALLAKGSARGPVGWARALLAAGLMLAPQLSATSILLLSPDHTGTAVPLLVTWLLIDRARPQWPISVLAGLLFTWTMVADSVVLLTGIIPLVLVCLLRSCPGLVRLRERPGSRRYELALAAAATAAGVAGSFVPRAITALGGYQQSPVGTDADFAQIQHGAWVTLQAFLELFGGNILGVSFFGVSPAFENVLVAVHLAGALLVAVAFVVGLARIFNTGELIVPVFAVAMAVNVAAYMISTHAQDLLGAREMAAVLPLGAVLAGRVLGDRLAAWTRAAKAWLVPVFTVLAAGYLVALGYRATQPAAPAVSQSLATWLAAHGLSDGLADYWQANSTTVDSRGRIVVSAVAWAPGYHIVPYLWETDVANYDPARRYANFVVAGGPNGLTGIRQWAEITYGRPARIYQADGYTILVWNTNLLAKLDGPGVK